MLHKFNQGVEVVVNYYDSYSIFQYTRNLMAKFDTDLSTYSCYKLYKRDLLYVLKMLVTDVANQNFKVSSVEAILKDDKSSAILFISDDNFVGLRYDSEQWNVFLLRLINNDAKI